MLTIQALLYITDRGIQTVLCAIEKGTGRLRMLRAAKAKSHVQLLELQSWCVPPVKWAQVLDVYFMIIARRFLTSQCDLTDRLCQNLDLNLRRDSRIESWMALRLEIMSAFSRNVGNLSSDDVMLNFVWRRGIVLLHDHRTEREKWNMIHGSVQVLYIHTCYIQLQYLHACPAFS